MIPRVVGSSQVGRQDIRIVPGSLRGLARRDPFPVAALGGARFGAGATIPKSSWRRCSPLRTGAPPVANHDLAIARLGTFNHSQSYAPRGRLSVRAIARLVDLLLRQTESLE